MRGTPAGPPAAGGGTPTDPLTFLRGIQLTSAEGHAGFTTIFPGHYPGRTNHVHFRVRTGGHPDRRTYAAGHLTHTGQILFPEEIAATIMANAAYAQAGGPRRVALGEDRVYLSEGGSSMLARTEALHPGDWAAGLSATIVVAVDTSAHPASPAAGDMVPPRPPARCGTAGRGW